MRVHKVGVELEGGWKEPFPEDDPTEIYADHSVHLQGFNHIGECASPPLSLEDALEWTDTHYPNGFDATCGMHVHVSLKKDEDYARLCGTPKFFMKFLLWGSEFLSKEFPKEGSTDQVRFYDRISGKNRFCALRFIPEKQMAISRKGGGNVVDNNPRYAMLNFSKNLHGTFENRVFPIFVDKKLALTGIKSYVELVEDFLETSPPFKGEVIKVVV